MAEPRFRVVLEPADVIAAVRQSDDQVYGDSSRPDLPSAYYLLLYEIDGQSFAYYPTRAEHLLSDLLFELGVFSAGLSHDIRVTGYPILVARVRNGLVDFVDVTLVREPPVHAAAVPLQEVISQLRVGVDELVAVLRARQSRVLGDFGLL